MSGIIMTEVPLTHLPEIKAELKYDQFRNVLLRLKPLEHLDIYQEVQSEENLDKHKICESFRKVLKSDLSLEEITSLYTVSFLMLLLSESQDVCQCHRSLDFLNECFNYTDALKPTMIHYATGDLLESCRTVSGEEEQYFVNILEVIPHAMVSSETGKMISLGLLRAFIADLTNTKIILHVYRNILEVWQMIKPITVDTILEVWPLRRSYILIKSFALLITAATFNLNNLGLRQAGYRGFEKPSNITEITDWFKNLKDKLNEKHKNTKSKVGQMLVRFIDSNILSLLTENGGNEVASEGGTETAA
ncbi:uncharacterized protein [Drosophila tropicalis]|uniref:uncharacterized protein n=1 Tax=Drosophila tropicalis TaxID=46794 RepID=UPI0035AB8F02